MKGLFATALMGLALLPGLAVEAAAGTLSQSSPQGGGDSEWREKLVSRFGSGPKNSIAQAVKDFPQLRQRLEVIADWVAQDQVDGPAGLRLDAVAAMVAKLGSQAKDFQERLAALQRAQAGPTDRRWAELYLDACHRRRQARLDLHRAQLAGFVFTKHFDMGGSHYAYTECLSDAQAEKHFHPGTSLGLWEFDGLFGKVRSLIDDAQGVIRDPDVSYDGKRLLFSWKKSAKDDDYHLYEMDLATRKVRQLTFGLGFADYEANYLPNGDIVFNSTRCIQTVPCWWTEVSNLFTCDGDGKYLRRLSFDQVHSNYPTVTGDGRVIYTRWEYNDRGQLFVQGLFQMNIDGTAQRELYGNNSWFPTTLLHARHIPGTQKYVAILTGHHTRQQGWLGIVDPTKGRQENSGVQLIAPVRQTDAVRIDRYAQTGDQFQYPYPLSETEFLVTFKPAGTKFFGIYFMTEAGERELLVSDAKISCNQPVVVKSRPVPVVRKSHVDYRQKTGTVYMHDVYAGIGLQGVPRGTIKSLRVVALDYRAAGVGHNGNSGPAGGALVSTPISIQGSWDVKVVLGTTPVLEDGSAFFTVPARTPLYFQALNAKGQAVQTMRSWMTLQPGEVSSCVGCHDQQSSTPPRTQGSLASQAGPQELLEWHGKPRGFSFVREIQPVLDRHCVRCHFQEGAQASAQNTGKVFEAKTMKMVVPCDGAQWSYTLDRPADTWMKPDFQAASWKVGPGGFGSKGTPGARIGTNWRSSDIWLRRTFDLKDVPAAPAFLCHHDEDVEIYINGIMAAQATGYTARYEVLPMTTAGLAALKPGQNTIAVHCHQTYGGQFIDVALIDAGKNPFFSLKGGGASPAVAVSPGVKPAFSLKSTTRFDPQSLRHWSDSYRALANRKYTNWINVQSEPSPLSAFHAGSAKSKLINILEEGHHGVKLAPEEMDRLATWIDLLVPYCGDFREGFEGANLEKYEHFLNKRRRWQAEEARNIEAFIRERQGQR